MAKTRAGLKNKKALHIEGDRLPEDLAKEKADALIKGDSKIIKPFFKYLYNEADAESSITSITEDEHEDTE